MKTISLVLHDKAYGYIPSKVGLCVGLMASGVKLGHKDPGYEIVIEVGNKAKKQYFIALRDRPSCSPYIRTNDFQWRRYSLITRTRRDSTSAL